MAILSWAALTAPLYKCLKIEIFNLEPKIEKLTCLVQLLFKVKAYLKEHKTTLQNPSFDERKYLEKITFFLSFSSIIFQDIFLELDQTNFSLGLSP